MPLLDTAYPVFKEIEIKANKYNEISLDNERIHVPRARNHSDIYGLLRFDSYQLISSAGEIIAEGHRYAYFMNEVMCIYRINVPNSATTNWRLADTEGPIRKSEEFIEMLNGFIKYTEYRYDKDIQLSKLTWKVQKNVLSNDYKEMKSKIYG